MPYHIKKYSNKGYKVCKKNSTKCFSKKPMPKKRAERQLKALYASENVDEQKTSFEQLFEYIMSK